MTNRGAVLVAGGAGYIGSQTCKSLHAAGYLPVTLDNLSTGHAPAVKWGPLRQGDIRDATLVKELSAEFGIRAAIHFAASSLVGESVSNPAKYYDNNVGAAVAFTQALIESGVKSLVFSSTAAVYGEPSMVPIPEDHAKAPLNPYGATKLAFEEALRWLGQAGGLNWTVLRYFNAAGADPQGEVGESHLDETHLIPLACQAALGRGPGLKVFGDDYDTPDGTAIRDYVHVADLAEAHVLSIGRLLAAGGNLAMNVGTGEGASVLKVVQAVEKTLGRPAPRTVGPRRAGDPARLVADARLIRTELGWVPRRSDLASIVKDAMHWQQMRPY